MRRIAAASAANACTRRAQPAALAAEQSSSAAGLKKRRTPSAGPEYTGTAPARNALTSFSVTYPGALVCPKARGQCS